MANHTSKPLNCEICGAVIGRISVTENWVRTNAGCSKKRCADHRAYREQEGVRA